MSLEILLGVIQIILIATTPLVFACLLYTSDAADE